MEKILQELRQIKQLLASQKQILTLDEFCVYAGISKSHAYHLTSTGKVPCYRPFGKLIYFDTEEVIDFLKQNKLSNANDTQLHYQNYFLKNKKH